MLLDNFNLSSTTNRVMVIGALYVVIFAFGFLLTRSGSPYNTVLLTVHKLASVAAVILLYKAFSAAHQTSGLSMFVIAVGVITGLAFIGTIATGGLISIGGQVPEVVYSLHRVMPVLTAVSTAASLYLLNNIG